MVFNTDPWLTQQAIKGPKITSVNTFKRENQQSNLYEKRENCSSPLLFILTPSRPHEWILAIGR